MKELNININTKDNEKKTDKKYCKGVVINLTEEQWHYVKLLAAFNNNSMSKVGRLLIQSSIDQIKDKLIMIEEYNKTVREIIGM